MPERNLMRGSPAADVFVCFDFGYKRIGVATGQPLTATASPLIVINNLDNGINWPAIDELIVQWQPGALVVGIPLSANGDEQPITRACRDFAQQLEARYQLPVHLVDERYSSIEANERFTAMRGEGVLRRRDRAKLDAVAAQHILERFFHDHAG